MPNGDYAQKQPSQNMPTIAPPRHDIALTWPEGNFPQDRCIPFLMIPVDRENWYNIAAEIEFDYVQFSQTVRKCVLTLQVRVSQNDRTIQVISADFAAEDKEISSMLLFELAPSGLILYVKGMGCGNTLFARFNKLMRRAGGNALNPIILNNGVLKPELLIKLQGRIVSAINIQSAQIGLGEKACKHSDKIQTEVTVNGERPYRKEIVSYSQDKQDLYVRDIFNFLGIDKPNYIDLGAYHPIAHSNTFLLYLGGSRGILVDADATKHELFKKHRPNDITLNIGVATTKGIATFHIYDNSAYNTFIKNYKTEMVTPTGAVVKLSREIEMPVVTLGEIVKTYANGKWPDFLDVDIEGLDFEVLQSCEFGSDGPIVINVESGHLKNFRDMMLGQGYIAYYRGRVDTIFIRADMYKKLFP